MIQLLAATCRQANLFVACESDCCGGCMCSRTCSHVQVEFPSCQLLATIVVRQRCRGLPGRLSARALCPCCVYSHSKAVTELELLALRGGILRNVTATVNLEGYRKAATHNAGNAVTFFRQHHHGTRIPEQTTATDSETRKCEYYTSWCCPYRSDHTPGLFTAPSDG
jgi:hypothetical protein